MQPIISVANVSKIYASGLKALSNINLDIRRGEIFALLGPNGAGKTTLIGTICGLVMASPGSSSGAPQPRPWGCRRHWPRADSDSQPRSAGTFGQRAMAAMT